MYPVSAGKFSDLVGCPGLELVYYLAGLHPAPATTNIAIRMAIPSHTRE